ncbi:MAG: hypothetical protein N2253_06705 [Bacteroidia bacterium]|nr:hypothetical protein [Bacteroidia bacterium]MCX7764563.1 hypothetical protein [Bacteroidia bacterium]MDW8058225.1 hypothetical protein [Bacteroidia bacterium]
MSVSEVINRLRQYEHYRSLRWAFIIGLLWVLIWGGVIVAFLTPSEVEVSEMELLAEEAYFYPIDL